MPASKTDIQAVQEKPQLKMHSLERVLARLGALPLAGAMVFALLSSSGASAQSSQPANTPAPSFEVASIKPNRSGDQRIRLMFAPDGLSANGLPLKELIGFAYNLKDFQISGGPGWIESERYDIEAKMDESTITALKKLAPEQAVEQRRLMVQSLLAERFNLKVSHSSKEAPIYAWSLPRADRNLRNQLNRRLGPRGQALRAGWESGGGSLPPQQFR